MNVGNGGLYALGDYHPENETWTTVDPSVTIDYGPDSAWEAGQFAGGRFMNIGWVNRGPPMLQQDDDDDDADGVGAGPYPHETTFAYAQPPPAGAPTNCTFTTHWEVFPGYTNIYNREPSPTNVTHGTLIYIGMFNSTDECFAAVNASKLGPFNSFTYNDPTLDPPYGRHCWADTSYTWQNRANAPGQVSGRGPVEECHRV